MTDHVRTICERLIDAGWTHTENGQQFNWANLVLDTPHAKLEVEHMRDWWMVNLILRGGAETRRLEVEAGDQLPRFLALLELRQRDLSTANWDAFADELGRASCFPGAFSAYVLEFGTGHHSPLDNDFVSSKLESILDGVNDWLGLGLHSLTMTFQVWIIHHGVLVRAVDVYPTLTAHLKDGTSVSLRDEATRERLSRQDSKLELTLDRAALSAACGEPLPPPVLEGSRLLCLRWGSRRPDPDRPSNLELGLRLHRGYNDIARRIDKEELRREEERGSPAYSLKDLPEGLDELDTDFSPEELRARGWEL